jgi:hypothetical protein
MGFLQKIKFWKKTNNKTPTKVDASVSTEDPPTCDAATVSMDPTVMCAIYTQTETTMDGGVGGAVKDEPEKKIRELEEELAVSKRLTADLMLSMKSVEQRLRKYAEEPVNNWSDDCECKHQVSAVADLLKKIIITERDVNNSMPETTFPGNTSVDCETQTEANSRRRDCANGHEQEIIRRLKDKNEKLSVLAEKYERKLLLQNEEMEHVLRDRASHIQHIKKRNEQEKSALLRKIRDMREEIISLKEPRTPPRERHTKDHRQKKRSDHTGSREAQWSEVIAGTRKIRSHTRHSESKPIPTIHNRYDGLNNC